MRMQMLAGMMLVAWGSVALAASGDKPLPDIDTSWSVTVGTDGHVTEITQLSKIAEPLAQPIATAIRGWEFEPGKLDGEPAATQTTLHVKITLVPHGSTHVALVDDARTGGRIDKTVAPTFPPSLMRRHQRDGIAALAIVEVEYDEDGKVVAATAAPDAPTIDKAFMQSAVDSVRRWTFVPERIGGHGVGATVQVPLCYVLEPARARPDAVPRCPQWQPAGLPAAVADGQVLADQPVALLKSDVIGRAL